MRKKKTIVALVIFFAALFLSPTAWAVDCLIPDTGQTKCYNDTAEIPCPQPGEPFYGQDAHYPCNPQSYTTLGGGIMVQDNVTGLIWEVKQDKDDVQNYKNPHDANNSYTWYDGVTGTPADGDPMYDTLDFLDALNDAEFGGYSDWRLPTIQELSFINNRDTSSPSIDTDHFPNTVSSTYWSSTSCVFDSSLAFDTEFQNGGIGYDWKDIPYFVRAVRGGQCGSSSNFVDNSDETVTDTDTGLMWQQDSSTLMNWGNALAYCENLSLAGYDDWRLPDLNELQSLVDYSRYDPAIDPTYFPNTGPFTFVYWSSTSTAVGSGVAWFVVFEQGAMFFSGKSIPAGYVRAVRGGQCGSLDNSSTTTITTEPTTTTTTDGSTTTTIDSETSTTSTGDMPTTTTSAPSCLSEQIYGEYSAETELLRHFRDNILSQTPEGKELIKLYYQWNPAIVKAMEEDEEFREQVKEMLDGILPLIGGEEE